jgi:hypothetical protein
MFGMIYMFLELVKPSATDCNFYTDEEPKKHKKKNLVYISQN